VTMTLVVLTILPACSRLEHQNIKVTYELVRAPFIATVEGEGVLEAENAQVLTAPDVRPPPTLGYLIPEGTVVEKGDLVARFESDEISQNYQNALDEVEIARAEAGQRVAELTLERLLYQSQRDAAEAAAESARLQLAKLKFEPPRTQEIKRLEIARHELDAKQARQKLLSLDTIQKEERARLQLRIRQAENKRDLARTHLDRLELRAPHSGFIVHEFNRISDMKVQEGDMLYPRMPVVRLPDLSVMLVNVLVGETDASKLHPGQRALITVPSLGGEPLTGSVIKVANVATPIRRGSKVKKVEVIVKIDGTRKGLVSGLSAVCRIEVKRLDASIAVPLECVFERDSVKVLYVLEGSRIEPRPVAPVIQTGDFMVVYGDLENGDRIALREPAASSLRWPDTLVTPVLPDSLAALVAEKNVRSQEVGEPGMEPGRRPRPGPDRGAFRPTEE